MRIARSLVLVTLLAGCTRPTALVCRDVTESGVCREPVRTIEVGRGFEIFATGYGMPHGRVRIRLFEVRRGGSETEVAATEIGVTEKAKFLASPLRVSHPGRYRIEIADSRGDVFRSVTVDAPRAVIRPLAPAMN